MFNIRFYGKFNPNLQDYKDPKDFFKCMCCQKIIQRASIKNHLKSQTHKIQENLDIINQEDEIEIFNQYNETSITAED